MWCQQSRYLRQIEEGEMAQERLQHQLKVMQAHLNKAQRQVNEKNSQLLGSVCEKVSLKN